jgi:PAS domain S-box-containing protein
MLGYTPGEFALLDIADLVVPPEPDNAQAVESHARLIEGLECALPFDTRLRQKDGRLREVVLTTSRVSFAGREGLIVNARDVSHMEQIEEALDVVRGRFSALTGNLDTGVFHAVMDDGGRLLDLNAAGRRIFGLTSESELPRHNLVHFFKEPEQGNAFLKALRDEGSVQRLVVWMNRADGETALVSLSATLGRYGLRRREYCDGLIEDVTERKRAEADRETVIAELQSSLLFLNEPLRHYVNDLASCELTDTIESVAARMSREGHGAVAVATGDGSVVGIVTDRDFRERVLVAQRVTSRPIHEIMSAPVIAVEQRALVYEALLVMQEHNIRHLAVRDETGRIVSLLRAKDLIHFDRYSASMLTDQCARRRAWTSWRPGAAAWPSWSKA